MIDLADAIDLHVHTAPDVYDRSVDDRQLVQLADRAGMKAILLKSHHTLTADRATLAAQDVEMPIFGGIALNHTVGGLNPIAAETAIEFGARQIWMPTIHAQHCMCEAKATAGPAMFLAEVERGRTGISVLDEQGNVTAEARAVLEVIRDADVILGTGHLAPAESLALLAEAQSFGISRMLVTHPLMSFTRFTVDQMRSAVNLGATLEFDYLSCSPKWQRAVDPDETAAMMRAIGPRHCVMATDGGQAYNPDPPQMLYDFAEAMHVRGMAESDLRMMMCTNPARLLDI